MYIGMAPDPGFLVPGSLALSLSKDRFRLSHPPCFSMVSAISARMLPMAPVGT